MDQNTTFLVIGLHLGLIIICLIVMVNFGKRLRKFKSDFYAVTLAVEKITTKEDKPVKDPEYYPGVEYQELFTYMHEEHGLTLVQSELDEIIRLSKGVKTVYF